MAQKVTFTVLLALITACSVQNYSTWEVYGGTKDGNRYSSLAQINRENVSQLKVLWEYSAGDLSERSQIQCQPIVVDGILYGTSPAIQVFALDAATGKELWKFNPFELLGGKNSWAGTNRGVTYWSGKVKGKEERRIYVAAGNWLIALNALTGKPLLTFGEGGKLDLREDLDYEKKEFLIVSNTPGVIYKDKLIMGMRLSEGLDAAPGHIRAYNIHTGKREWIFHTIPYPGEAGYETWEPESYKNVGGANNWAGMALDEKNELVFVPTGTASYDFWGGYRHGENLYANCLLALDANTGKLVWHYQAVHHDIWDRDFPSPPTLATIIKDGKKIDIVAQPSKQGYLYVFERKSGKPLFPIEEIPVPPSELPGEQSWPTQPKPTLPEPFMRMSYDESTILDISPEHTKEVKERLADLRYGNMWLPPGEKGHVHFPGMDGGAEWGGASFDHETGYLILNANEIPWIITMAKNPKAGSRGEEVYAANCASCHGMNREGNMPSFPSLKGLENKYTSDRLFEIISQGKGAMPGFSHLKEDDRKALVNYISDITPSTTRNELMGEDAYKKPLYLMQGYKRFLTADGFPAISPPWGTLNAINLASGKVVWKTPLGEYPELTKKGIPITGTENYGGPVSTAGGLIFIAASKDEKIRAFDKYTGKMLWEAPLPASGHATPAVYEVNGKQFVTIACGGGKGSPSGDKYVCFGL